MFATTLILIFSIILFAYWFRYTCLLVLNVNRADEHAIRMAAANRLSFPEVQDRLRSNNVAALDRLYESLDRDFRMLNYLLNHAIGFDTRSVERRLLTLDYRVMQFWFHATRAVSTAQARRSLEEMSRVVTYLATQLGRQSARQTVA